MSSIKSNKGNKYAQIVLGPPGSGKTTYCHKMCEFFKQIKRDFLLINLDPANENMLYTPDIDIMNLITVEDAMQSLSLGPNGALMYCMELLETNFDWLKESIEKSPTKYLIFDCPGQVELYTHHQSMKNIFGKLENCGFRLCSVNLIDSHYCNEPHKFISTLLLSLNTMLQMEFPHVNVLSKADLLKEHESKLDFNLEFYTEVLDLSQLLEVLDNNPCFAKYKKLNEAIVSLVEGYSLVTYQPLNSNNLESLRRLLSIIDKANGYAFNNSTEEQSINGLLACAVGAESSKTKFENDYQPYE